MKTRLYILAIAIICAASLQIFSQASGPYLFVSDNVNGVDQFYSEGVESYGGIRFNKGLNLLATVLGDDPANQRQGNQQLVPTASFEIVGGNVTIQPFAATVGGNARKFGLPYGARLKEFLYYPLGKAWFDLTLPFDDQNVALSDHSGAVRTPGGSVFHFAIDFDYSSDTRHGFDIIAPADGIIEGNSIPGGGSSMAIKHTAANGRQFLTYYQHLVPASNKLAVGKPVKRGDKIGRVESRDADGNPAYTHLHFGVAVKGPARTINGVDVPEMWYEIDPFGVYDYRRNRDSDTAYNYLPNNTITRPVRGMLTRSVFRTNPIIGSLLLPEDCLSIDPGSLSVSRSGNTFQVVDGTRTLFVAPSRREANRIISILRNYEPDQICYIGRPDASFQYLLRNNSSPSGYIMGEDCVAFDPDRIEIAPIAGGRYQMSSDGHTMLDFPNMLEAGNALSAIKKYGFKLSCYVGRPDPSFTYFRKYLTG